MAERRYLIKTLRYLLNRYGSVTVQQILSALVADPTERYQALHDKRERVSSYGDSDNRQERKLSATRQ